MLGDKQARCCKNTSASQDKIWAWKLLVVVIDCGQFPRTSSRELFDLPDLYWSGAIDAIDQALRRARSADGPTNSLAGIGRPKWKP
jgi:hypothetical protein